MAEIGRVAVIVVGAVAFILLLSDIFPLYDTFTLFHLFYHIFPAHL